jgi:hypothetical protein
MTGADRRRLPRAIAAALALGGCSLIESFADRPPPWTAVRGERSRAPPAAPVRRLLVLPFTEQDAVAAHADALRAAFAQVLREACGFDVVSPDLATLPRTTREELLAGGARDVPALVRLHREWGADAVLYGRLAFSRPHGDPGVGLELELIDARDGARLWRAQDAVDSSDPGVRACLLRFRRDESGGEAIDPAQIPYESFARFVAASFVRTLFEPLPEPAPAPAARAAAEEHEAPGN